jgi:hypothetical protein
MQKFGAAILSKASCSDADQALLDLVCHAVDNCMRMDGLLFVQRQHLAEARDALEAAGARPAKSTLIDGESLPAAETVMSTRAISIATGVLEVDAMPTALSSPTMAVLDMIAASLGKRDAGHQPLLDIAHDCVAKLTDNAYCIAAKSGARHSKETLGHLARAHGHLVAAGARCGAREFTEDGEAAETDVERRKIAAIDLAKMVTGGRGDNPALMAALNDILPRLDRLTQRVEDIARTPLPPLTMAKDVTVLSKRQDVGAGGASPDDLAAAFARMSKEDQTLMLIKASYARPIQPPGLTLARDPRGE